MTTESDGLIFACVLDKNGACEIIGWDEINQWSPDKGLLWVHLDYQNTNAQHWIENNSQVNEVVAQSLLAEESRPRFLRHGGELLLNLRGVNTTPGSEPEDLVSIRIYCDGRRLISTRKRRLMSVQDIQQSFAEKSGPCSMGELVANLATRLTERMADVIQDLDDSIDQIEDELIENNSQTHHRRILNLRRQIILLRRYLAPQKEALTRLSHENLSWITDRDFMAMRESTDRVMRYVEELDSCRERATILYEELRNRLAEELNNRMYLLSIVAALFLPLGFLTGLLGINVGGIPLAENGNGFVIISILLFIIIAFQLIIFKMKRWF